MAVTIDSLKRQRPARPPVILIYGPSGIGKSSMALSAPSPILLPTEPVRAKFSHIPQFDLLSSVAQIDEALDFLTREPHDFRTAVLDSVDWAEGLVGDKVARAEGKASPGEVPYGRGWAQVAGEMQRLRGKIIRLNTERKMAVVLVAHSKLQRVEPPNAEAYDRYAPDLHKEVLPGFVEFSDYVLFADFKQHVVKKQLSEGTMAIGKGERVLYCAPRPAFIAKNAVDLPPELPFEDGTAWRTFLDAVKRGTKTTIPQEQASLETTEEPKQTND